LTSEKKNSKRNEATVLDDEPDNRMANGQAGNEQGQYQRAAGNGKGLRHGFGVALVTGENSVPSIFRLILWATVPQRPRRFLPG